MNLSSVTVDSSVPRVPAEVREKVVPTRVRSSLGFFAKRDKANASKAKIGKEEVSIVVENERIDPGPTGSLLAEPPVPEAKEPATPTDEDTNLAKKKKNIPECATTKKRRASFLRTISKAMRGKSRNKIARQETPNISGEGTRNSDETETPPSSEHRVLDVGQHPQQPRGRGRAVLACPPLYPSSCAVSTVTSGQESYYSNSSSAYESGLIPRCTPFTDTPGMFPYYIQSGADLHFTGTSSRASSNQQRNTASSISGSTWTSVSGSQKVSGSARSNLSSNFGSRRNTGSARSTLSAHQGSQKVRVAKRIPEEEDAETTPSTTGAFAVPGAETTPSTRGAWSGVCKAWQAKVAQSIEQACAPGAFAVPGAETTPSTPGAFAVPGPAALPAVPPEDIQDALLTQALNAIAQAEEAAKRASEASAAAASAAANAKMAVNALAQRRSSGSGVRQRELWKAKRCGVQESSFGAIVNHHAGQGTTGRKADEALEVATAISNAETFPDVQRGSTTLEQLGATSTGIQGWVAAAVEEKGEIFDLSHGVASSVPISATLVEESEDNDVSEPGDKESPAATDGGGKGPHLDLLVEEEALLDSSHEVASFVPICATPVEQSEDGSGSERGNEESSAAKVGAGKAHAPIWKWRKKKQRSSLTQIPGLPYRSLQVTMSVARTNSSKEEMRR